MKVKKLLIGLLVSGLTLSFTGCGDKVINDKGEKVQSFGQFIEINKTSIVLSDGYTVDQYFVYDKTTKVVYVFQGLKNFSGITPHIMFWIKMVNQKSQFTGKIIVGDVYEMD